MRTVVPVVLATLAIVGTSAAPLAARQAGEIAPFKKGPVADPLPRRGFNIVLLVGEMLGPGYPKPIPAAAMKALSDMRDFLPYKGYSLLDTQWIIGGTSSPALTRLRGLDGQDYELELRVSPMPTPDAKIDAGALSVRFVLREPGDTVNATGEGGRTPFQPKEIAKTDTTSLEIGREIFQLERERTELRGRLRALQAERGAKNPVDARALESQIGQVVQQTNVVDQRIQVLKQIAAAETARTAGRPVIDTSFRMDDGETVVVGTSKMKGSNALIALLTATSDRAKAASK